MISMCACCGSTGESAKRSTAIMKIAVSQMNCLIFISCDRLLIYVDICHICLSIYLDAFKSPLSAFRKGGQCSESFVWNSSPEELDHFLEVLPCRRFLGRASQQISRMICAYQRYSPPELDLAAKLRNRAGAS